MKTKYALVNEERREAERGLLGKCPVCKNPVIAKCGDIRVKHWAHKGKRSCDIWWENETEWHRAWKDKFPRECQEFIQHDELGEKHIADVRTNHGLVIEFQHSHLDPKERDAREHFYKNMVWVVDGTRLEKNYQRFQKGIGGLTTTKKTELILCATPSYVFPWIGLIVQSRSFLIFWVLV
jgi:competence protein CoiA